jgi:ABC-type transport system involved in cytochrome c biogenesis permease subunit
MRFLVIFFSLLFAFPLHAASPLPMQDFGNLPIAHAGRIKPLSVFAREQLKFFSGKEEYRKHPAIDWLAMLLFTPEAMEHAPLLKVESEPLRETLNLSPQAGHLYSLQSLRLAMQQQMQPVLEALLLIQKKQPATKLQEEMAELYAKLGRFQQLQESFAFALPFPAVPKETLDSLSQKQRQKHQAFVQQMQERGALSTILAILPTQWKGKQDWVSPWALRFNGLGSPQLAVYQQSWLKLMEAYRNDDAAAWKNALTDAHQALNNLQNPDYFPAKLALEEWYYKLSFLSLAVVCYGVFVLLFLLIPLSPAGGVRGGCQTATQHPHPSPPPQEGEGVIRLCGYDKLGYLPLLLGIAFHGLALLVRMVILGRPPVSNLYESVLFVSLLITVAGLAIAYKERKNIIAMMTALFSAGLLLISQTLLEGQEHLPVVMAVLNTNFWLGTHVICITSGYAAAVITSLYAHYILWRNADTKKLHWLAIIALLLTAVGTLLGGIWADQSWGRFWGWDPKENGAMLIVLWLIWLIHGKLVGQISERWYLAGMCYLSVTVALAWFGVNLLSVGLHSYGFMEGTALGLFLFILLETILTAWLLWQSREKTHYA